MIKLAAFILAAVIALALRSQASAESDAVFYVSPNGSDIWSGKLATANSARTNGPFATVDRARLAVRELRAKEKKPVRVVVREGTYYLESPLVLEPEDSGDADNPVVYAAYPGERPVISGGVKLTGWKTQDLPPSPRRGGAGGGVYWKINERGWWRLDLPEVKSKGWNFISLYVNGERRYRPRLPKSGCYYVAVELPLDAKDPNAKPDGFEFVPGHIRADWHNLGDVEVQTVHYWNMSRMRIKSVDEKNDVVKFTGTTYAVANWAQYMGGTPYWVENVREALGEPGTFYLDRSSGELIYVPRKNESPSKTEVVAPRLENLLRLAGDTKNRRYIEHITFKGLTFAHSNWPTPDRGYHFPQSDATLPSAITVEGARNCRFNGCSIERTGAYGIEFNAGCKFNTVENCKLTDLGAGGVKLGFWAPIQPEENAVSHNIVRNNLIAHGGRIQPGGTGIMLGNSHHNRISRNDIFDLYYDGISLGYSWDETVTAHHNVIEDNHIFGIGQGVLSDMGAIYTLGLSPGTKIRHNLIHDINCRFYGGWGIYLDAKSSEILVEDNIVYKTDSGAFHSNCGRDNIVVNNIFALGDEQQLVRSQGQEKPTFDFRRNIIYWKDSFILGSNWEDYNYRMDQNLYWDASERPLLFGALNLDGWREKGLDKNSMVADPLFKDPQSSDFTLPDNSPALSLGFKPIPQSGFGRTNAESADVSFYPLAFPNVTEPEPVRYDFEDSPTGRKAPFCTLEEENETAVIRVTDETAASGKRCLKFTDDGKQKYSYHPFVSYTCKCIKGRVTVRFSTKMQPGSHMRHEWRDTVKPDKPGPSIAVDNQGNLIANGRTLGKVPHGKWIHFEIVCSVGAGAPGDYTLKVQTEGAKAAQTYRALKCDPGFHKLMGFLFIAEGTNPGVFYIDDISATWQASTPHREL